MFELLGLFVQAIGPRNIVTRGKSFLYAFGRYQVWCDRSPGLLSGPQTRQSHGALMCAGQSIDQYSMYSVPNFLC